MHQSLTDISSTPPPIIQINHAAQLVMQQASKLLLNPADRANQSTLYPLVKMS